MLDSVERTLPSWRHRISSNKMARVWTLEESMPLIYRGMLVDSDKPRVMPGAKGLGVRIGDAKNDDLAADTNSNVHPGTGGMSVAPTPDDLPTHRLPKRLKAKYPNRFQDASGPDTFACWWMGQGPFLLAPVADRLQLRPDPQRPQQHGFVEPAEVMSRTEYEGALAETRDQWRRWEE
jgi:hypothetical protein